MISPEFAAAVGKTLARECPHVNASPEHVEKLRVKIVSYASTVAEPPVDLVMQWAAEDEAALTTLADAEEARLEEAAEVERQADAARQHRRALENRTADEDRRLAEEEFRAAHPKAERPPLTPNTSYTLAEQDKMSADEYAVKVLGLPAPKLNLSQPLAKNEKDPKTEAFKKAVMRNKNPNKDRQLAMELRRRILTGEIK